MQYSAAQGYFSPEIARFFSFLRLNRFERARSRRRARGAGISPNASPKPTNCDQAARDFAMPAQSFRMRLQPSTRSGRGHIVQRIAAQSPNSKQAARDFAMPAQSFRMPPQSSGALGVRAYRPTHRPKPTNCDQPARDFAMLAQSFRTRPQPSTRSGRGHIAQRIA